MTIHARRVKIDRIYGMTSFALSKFVGELPVDVFKSRRKYRSGDRPSPRCMKMVLRVLSDNYPNVWPSVETIAAKAGYGTTATRRALRELERKKWINAIAPDGLRPKVGGAGLTVQYALSVSKILEAVNKFKSQRNLLASKGNRTRRVAQKTTDSIENPTDSTLKATDSEANPTDSIHKATEAVGEQRSEQRRVNRENKQKISTAASEHNVDGVVAGTDQSSRSSGQDGERAGSLSGQPSVNRLQFLAEARRIFAAEFPRNDFQATQKHLDESWAVAAQLGPTLFLVAWEHWLRKAGRELFVAITRRNRKTGNEYKGFVLKTWLLHEFVNSGAVMEHANKVQPFANLTKDIETLAFLVRAQTQSSAPVTVTAENVGILSAFLRRHGPEELEDEYELYAGSGSMDDFIAEVVAPRLGVPHAGEIQQPAEAAAEVASTGDWIDELEK